MVPVSRLDPGERTGWIDREEEDGQHQPLHPLSHARHEQEAEPQSKVSPIKWYLRYRYLTFCLGSEYVPRYLPVVGTVRYRYVFSGSGFNSVPVPYRTYLP